MAWRTSSRIVSYWARRSTIGILMSAALDTGLNSRRTAFQCILRDFGENLVMVMVEREDAKLDDLRGNVFKQLRQSLFGNLAARRVEDMNLFLSHRKRIFR